MTMLVDKDTIVFIEVYKNVDYSVVFRATLFTFLKNCNIEFHCM